MAPGLHGAILLLLHGSCLPHTCSAHLHRRLPGLPEREVPHQPCSTPPSASLHARAVLRRRGSSGVTPSRSLLAVPRSRGTQLEPFVVTSLVQLLCRMTKLCWFDDDAFHSIVDDAKTFLEKARPALDAAASAARRPERSALMPAPASGIGVSKFPGSMRGASRCDGRVGLINCDGQWAVRWLPSAPPRGSFQGPLNRYTDNTYVRRHRFGGHLTWSRRVNVHLLIC